MTDLRDTIAPKSDQLNADDLLAGPRTITVTKVSRCSEPDQPIAINFEDDNRKPFKPCKSMRRVLVKVWGPDGNTYAGRRMTLYRDDGVQFGGQAVGGIRISHMSHIDRDVTMALTATRANRKPFTVRPLKDAPPAAAAQARQEGAPAQEGASAQPKRTFRDYLDEKLASCQSRDDVAALVGSDPLIKERMGNAGVKAAVEAAFARFADAEAAPPPSASEGSYDLDDEAEAA